MLKMKLVKKEKLMDIVNSLKDTAYLLYYKYDINNIKQFMCAKDGNEEVKNGVFYFSLYPTYADPSSMYKSLHTYEVVGLYDSYKNIKYYFV